MVLSLHTFASHYVMSGGNILALSKILGHSKLEATMIYAHLAPNFMAGEIARLSFDAPPAAKVIPLSRGKRVA